MRKYLLAAALATSALAVTHCEAAKEAASKALGNMTLKGKVTRAGSGVAIEGATVRAIPLLDLEAIKKLIEYRKVPDGDGGEKDQIRIKLDKVHGYAGEQEIKTDASGKFELSVPVNVYLVYTYGPGDAPGSATAYTPHFWGINPETGELDMEHLIGNDKKLEQVNDKIELGGGPVPPPADTPIPEAPPAPVAATNPVPEATPPAPASPPAADRPEDVVPPAPSATFWKSINLTHGAGILGDSATPPVYTSAIEVAPAEGERYMALVAELNAAQTDPVFLVIQTGFDSTTVSDCATTRASAQTHIYPVTPNGTMVEYKLVSPGTYYRLFFAKTATQTEGQPVEATEATRDLSVGVRTCANAVPERPFLATLTWNRESDVDLHVKKYELAKVAAGQIEEALVDQANWTRREGISLSLDVDNTWANGPENNGESEQVTDPDAYCYVVQLHLYAQMGSEPVETTVHVMHVSKENNETRVNQYEQNITLTEYGQWKPVGIYGPAGCSALTESTSQTTL